MEVKVTKHFPLLWQKQNKRGWCVVGFLRSQRGFLSTWNSTENKERKRGGAFLMHLTPVATPDIYLHLASSLET